MEDLFAGANVAPNLSVTTAPAAEPGPAAQNGTEPQPTNPATDNAGGNPQPAPVPANGTPNEQNQGQEGLLDQLYGGKVISKSGAAEGGKPTLVLVEDPVTHRRTVKFTKEEPDAQPQPAAPAEQNPVEPPPQQNVFPAINTQPQPAAQPVAQPQPNPADNLQNIAQQQNQPMPEYTAKELAVAIATNAVDESRVPADLKAIYVQAMIQKAQHDYTAYVNEQQKQREELAKQVQSNNNPQGQQEFLQKLSEESARMALQSLGMTKEDYDAKVYDNPELEEKFRIAREWHANRIMGEIQERSRQEAAVMAQRKNTYAQINSYIDRQRATEPHFAEIDAMCGTLYQNMEYKYSARIAQAMQSAKAGSATDDDAEVLRQYYEFGRKVYYAKKNNLNPNQPTPAPQRNRPPVVENAGNGQQLQNGPTRPNPIELRGKGPRERAEFFKKYFNLQ